MGEAGGIIEDGIRALSYVLSEIIYDLIIWIYNIFERLCNSRILDSDILEVLAERIGIILGLIMLFVVTFSVIQMVLEPDKMTDKEKGIGNIAKKIILVVVMLGLSSSAFRLLYGLQKNLIDSNIIQKFLLPYEIKEGVDFGGVLSSNLFVAFYQVNDITFKNAESDFDSLNTDEKKCVNLFTQLKTDIMNKNGFLAGKDCVNVTIKRGTSKEYIMSFNWVLLPLVGLAVLYFIFSYCISVGIRTVQLAFLEIISPMAIVSYLSPKKDTMFQKWTKLYFSTYIDVFLRIAIINLIVFLIMTLFERTVEWEFWNSVGREGNFSDTAILVLIVIALLMFAKKAPDLLKELFPSSTSKLGLGITSPKKLLSSMAGEDLIKRGYGVISVGTQAHLRNTRKAIGNVWDKMHDKDATADDKWTAWGRLGGTLLTGGLGGARRGLMTTNASGRSKAVNNAFAARQATYKMRDLEYGSSLLGLFTEKGRRGAANYIADKARGVVMKDLHVDDMADMKDLNIESLQQRLIEAQKKDTHGWTISKSKSHANMYIVDDGSGHADILDEKAIKGKFGTMRDASGNVVSNGVEEALEIAKLKAKIGKATGDSKKLHQKAEEQKQKNSK